MSFVPGKFTCHPSIYIYYVYPTLITFIMSAVHATINLDDEVTSECIPYVARRSFFEKFCNIPASIGQFYRKYVPVVYDDEWQQDSYWLK